MKTASEKPAVFIGSSKEGLSIAKYLQLGLAQVARCTIWTQGVFGLSQNTLESLIEATQKSDFAILVLTPDDLGLKRGARRNLPRDNVIFELGLFMGALGRHRTFIVHSRDASLELPSDLDGVTTAMFSVGENDDLRQGLGPVCTLLEEAIRQRSGKPSEDLAGPMRELLGLWNCTWSVSSDGSQPIRDRVSMTTITGDTVLATGSNRKFGNYDLVGRATPAGVLTFFYKGDSRRHFSGGVVILKLKASSVNEMEGLWYEYDADRQFYGGTTTWKKARGHRSLGSKGTSPRRRA